METPETKDFTANTSSESLIQKVERNFALFEQSKYGQKVLIVVLWLSIILISCVVFTIFFDYLSFILASSTEEVADKLGYCNLLDLIAPANIAKTSELKRTIILGGAILITLEYWILDEDIFKKYKAIRRIIAFAIALLMVGTVFGAMYRMYEIRISANGYLQATSWRDNFISDETILLALFGFGIPMLRTWLIEKLNTYTEKQAVVK